MHTETRDAAAVVDAVIRSRKTVRAFRPDPVPQAQLVEILEVARMAPSNFNTQPWRVHVLAGEPKRALSEAISRVHSANTHAPFSPFPQPSPPECAARLDDFGRRYYAALGIEVLQGWGMTETSPLATVSKVTAQQSSLSEDERFAVLAKQGYPLPLVDVRTGSGSIRIE